MCLIILSQATLIFSCSKTWSKTCNSALLNETFSEGFTGTSGPVKPRSSVDVDELRSSKSMDDGFPYLKFSCLLGQHLTTFPFANIFGGHLRG